MNRLNRLLGDYLKLQSVKPESLKESELTEIMVALIKFCPNNILFVDPNSQTVKYISEQWPNRKRLHGFVQNSLNKLVSETSSIEATRTYLNLAIVANSWEEAQEWLN